MASADPVAPGAERGKSPLERYVRQLLREARWVQEATQGRPRLTPGDQPPVADAVRQQTPVAGD
jgi:hypothetical protein